MACMARMARVYDSHGSLARTLSKLEKERQKVSARNVCAVVLAFAFPGTLINSHTNCSNYTSVFNVLVSSITARQAKIQTTILFFRTFPNHRSIQNKIKIHVYRKRQTSGSCSEFLRIEKSRCKHSRTIHMVKTGTKLLIFV